MSTSLTNARILIVEDEPISAHAMGRALDGYTVEVLRWRACWVGDLSIW